MSETLLTIIIAIIAVIVNFVLVLAVVSRKNKEVIKRINSLEATSNSVVEVLQDVERKLDVKSK